MVKREVLNKYCKSSFTKEFVRNFSRMPAELTGDKNTQYIMRNQQISEGMDFLLTEDQEMLRAMVEDFATRELEPIAAQIDEKSMFPTESVIKERQQTLLSGK